MPHPVAVPFAILTSPRTGSAWLVDTLHSHPQAVAYTELFLLGGGAAPYAGVDRLRFDDYLAGYPSWLRPARTIQRIAYLEKVFRERSGITAAGFKLMYAQARKQRGIFPYFAARRVRVIHLVRANSLEALISYQLAKKTGIFHPRRGDSLDQEVTVSLDVEVLRDWLEAQELNVSRARASIERYRLPRLEIAYEELVGRRKETLGRVLRFLGIDEEAELDSALMKMNQGRHLERVENLAAVRAELVGTRFEWMLGAERVPSDG